MHCATVSTPYCWETPNDIQNPIVRCTAGHRPDRAGAAIRLRARGGGRRGGGRRGGGDRPAHLRHPAGGLEHRLQGRAAGVAEIRRLRPDQREFLRRRRPVDGRGAHRSGQGTGDGACARGGKRQESRQPDHGRPHRQLRHALERHLADLQGPHRTAEHPVRALRHHLRDDRQRRRLPSGQSNPGGRRIRGQCGGGPEWGDQGG
ncbi:hypothetical protein BOFL111202_25870 [Bordetella flabilis]